MRREEMTASELRRLYWGRGWSLDQIAARYQVSEGTIRNRMKAAGIPCRPKGLGVYTRALWVYARARGHRG